MSNRALVTQTDAEIIALFKDLFTVEVKIERVIFDQRSLADIERLYAGGGVIEFGTRHDLPVLAIDGAISNDDRKGMVLAVDLDLVRIWTFYP